MVTKKTVPRGARALAAAVGLAIAWFSPAGADQASPLAQKPTIAKSCTLCHAAQSGVVRGKLANVSNKAQTIQVDVDRASWLIRFGDGTEVVNAESLKAIKKDHEIAVTYVEQGGKPFASRISSKPAAKVAPEKLVFTEDVLELVKKSPAEGAYVLVDARPGPKYQEGFIPNAVSMPFPAFDKMYEKVLPQDKDMLVVFYCGGVT